jgi:hypothetical protein
MKTKTAARVAEPKPCEHCGHCPTCGHTPREVVKHVPVPMPYPVPVAPAPPVYPWMVRPYQPYWSTVGGSTYVGDLPSSRFVNHASVRAESLGMLMNCN